MSESVDGVLQAPESAATAPPSVFLARFTAADDTVVADYVPDVPANGFAAASTGRYKIFNNSLAVDTRAAGYSTVKWDLGASPPGTYTVTAKMVMLDSAGNSAPILVLCAPAANIGYENAYNLYFYAGKVWLDNTQNGSFAPLDSANYSPSPDQVVEVRVEITPSNITVFLDEVEILSTNNTFYRGRYFGYSAWNTNNGRSDDDPVLDDLRVFTAS